MKLISSTIILFSAVCVPSTVLASTKKERIGEDVGGTSQTYYNTNARTILDGRSSTTDDMKDRLDPTVGGASGRDQNNNGRNNVIDGRQVDDDDSSLVVDMPPNCGEMDMHHDYPCDIDVDSPEMTVPTSTPVGPRTDPPVLPTNPPTKEPCVSTDGSFGMVGNEDGDVPITYIYEMETVPGTTELQIEDVILPRLEKVIVDSVLPEAFPVVCSNIAIGKRQLSLRTEQRRLVVTGITMLPPDTINTEVVCESGNMTSPDNRCDVVNGQLTVYTDNGDANGAKARIEAVIKENMDNGVYAASSPDIVRLRYLDALPSTPGIDSGDGNTGTETTDDTTTNSRDLRVGLFVGMFVLAAILAGVLYRTRRNMRNADDTTDLQTSNEASAVQSQTQPQDFNAAGIESESYDQSYDQSYDDTGMVMADTGMDSDSSDNIFGVTA